MIVIVTEQEFCEFCAPNVNYTRQNLGTATEKLAFECDKCFTDANTNLHQQNP